jgi:hypothetical protein
LNNRRSKNISGTQKPPPRLSLSLLRSGLLFAARDTVLKDLFPNIASDKMHIVGKGAKARSNKLIVSIDSIANAY